MLDMLVIMTFIIQFLSLVILFKALLDYKKVYGNLDKGKFKEKKFKRQTKKFIIYNVIGIMVFLISGLIRFTINL